LAIKQEEDQATAIVARCTYQFSDTDGITRRFYHRFKTEHNIFQTSIQGIAPAADRAAYASLIFSRLMFLYFMQKKGGLNDDANYLANHLHMMQDRNDHDVCLSFYRYFLLPLFHERLGTSAYSHPSKLDTLLGKVPYLHCGLFDEHKLERDYADIQIADDAFVRLFAFFDAYQWQLDERPPSTDNEINPDILGHIFEQYVNQKQMGAYYTKEDISGYIAQNTIISFLFDAAEKKYPTAFKLNGPIWRLLRENPDRYIYEAVRCESHLPAETDQEYAARRKRYAEIKTRLLAGKIVSINDFITYNLDIHRFAMDVIENCERDFLCGFYESLEQMSILDPTCGSGAFLLAALKVLEPLYEGCVERLDRTGSSRRYLILKSIILNNLYGVDIMEEATEICKLRLLLKLMAHVEHIDDIEPLPNLDGNIRAGNALIGFATVDEVKQINHASIPHLTRTQLDHALAREYGIDLQNGLEIEHWRASHQPFHWFFEFNKIMKHGGFDIIIGNPPYAEYSTVKNTYALPPGIYQTMLCGNLYAFCMERFAALSKPMSASGLIVPLSIVCTNRMAPLRRILYSAYSHLWFNNYDTIPGTLFSGIVQRNSIILASRRTSKPISKVYTTRNQKWYASERASLFESVCYLDIRSQSANDLVPKVSTPIELNILDKIHTQRCAITSYTQRHSHNTLVYKRRWSYFLLFADNIEGIVLPDGSTRQQQDVKTLALQPHLDRYVFIALLSSSLFYFHYSVFSDFRHVNKADFDKFMFDYTKLSEDIAHKLSTLGKTLMQSYRDNLQWRACNYIGSIGECRVPFYRQGASKLIIDAIDTALAEYYGLTDEELDFIINYDSKYRMGRFA
jgi:hypothetical protein